jgi:hypothetical protein
MSKIAERKALEAYPMELHPNILDSRYQTDINARPRKAFIEGYEQAEKDLELTWEDIKTIEQIITTSDWYDFEINGKLWSKEFYEEVLKRFEETRK